MNKTEIVETLKQSLGVELRKRRLEMGYTGEQMAEKIEASYSHYRALEGGASLPSVPTLCSLCNALHTSPEVLLSSCLEWNTLLEYQELKERFGNMSAQELKKANQLLEALRK